jgi:NTE family protein
LARVIGVGIEKADMLISVLLAGFDSREYNRAEELIKMGYQAAQAKAAVLSALSVDEPTWQAYLAQRSARRLTTPAPQFVKIVGTSPKLATAIEKDLKDNIGKPVDTAALQNQLMDLKGDGRFSNLNYEMTSRDGKPGLLITGVEKPYAPPIVQPLLLFDGSSFGGVNFSMGARITFLDFGAYRAELRNDLIVGSQYGINSQYYRPFTASSKWFIAPNGFADYLQYPIYHGDVFVSEYRKSSVGGGLELNYEFDRISQLTRGYTGAYESFVPKIGNQALLPNVSGRFGGTTLRWVLNGVDDPVIPRSGQYMDISSTWVDANPGAAFVSMSEGHWTNSSG